jgi:glycosyltransferase involved in cell wall biosynthesis
MALGHGKSLFPFKVFEYLAAARPVVTSQISEVSPAMEGGLVRYNEDSPEALAEALNLCLSTYSKWSAQALLAAAEVKSQYSVSAVAERIEKVLLAA